MGSLGSEAIRMTSNPARSPTDRDLDGPSRRPGSRGLLSLAIPQTRAE
jgi:hypothetical protein